MNCTSTPWLCCFNFVITPRESLVLYLLSTSTYMHSKIKYLLAKETSQVVAGACLHYVWEIKRTLYYNSAGRIKDYARQGKSDPVRLERSTSPSHETLLHIATSSGLIKYNKLGLLYCTEPHCLLRRYKTNLV